MILNYNNTIVSSVVDFIQGIIDILPNRDQRKRKIVITNYEVTSDESNDLFYYIKNSLTYEFNLLFEYEIIEEGKEPDKGTFEISIPKLLGNAFIVEGKLRVPTTTLGSDPECRVYDKSGLIVFDSERKVYNESPLKLELVEDYETVITVDGIEENFEKYRESLRLTPRQIMKLKIKLNSEDVGEYITEDLCKRLFKLPSEKLEDSIIDKIFINPESSLIMALRSRETKKELIKQMRSKFYQYGNVYTKDIQNAITKYFKRADDSSVEIPSNVNPLVYNALSSKLQIPKYVAYNSTFLDLIDPVNTPENNNVNKINELNVCTVIERGEPYILCYKYPTFERIKVYYLEYLNSKVIENSNVDYKREVITGLGYYKLRLHRYKITEDDMPTDGWLIEPKPDEKLSLTSRQIPLINTSDTVRVAMGAGMAKQAVELENAEPAYVTSGNEEDDYLLDTTRLYYDGEEGEVKKINDRNIYIKTNSGNIIPYEIPSTTVGLNNSIISYVVVVKVGDRVKRGSLLVSSYMTKDKTYNLGLNTRVAYMFYKGYNHEDAIIVSESFAKRATAYQIIDVKVPILFDDSLYKVLPIGMKVKSLDILVNKASAIRMRKTTKQAWMIPLMSFARLDKAQSNVLVPNNIDQGILTDVNINLNPDWERIVKENDGSKEIAKATIEALNEYEEKKKTSLHTTDELPERYWGMKAPTSEFEKDKEEIAVLTLRIIKIAPVIKGTKFCNRWGSKGEVSLILPDDQMPMDENGRPFEMLLNPPSTTSRKNPSQIIETLLTKILDKIYTISLELIEENRIDNLREFLRRYYDDQFDDYVDEELVKGIKDSKAFLRFKVGSYTTYGRDKVLGMAKELEVSEKEYVTDPDPEIGELENPVITGDSYYMRLYHSSDYTAKVTSSIVDSKAPIIGMGAYREDGQKMGEMESWGSMAHGVDHLLKPNTLIKEGVFLNELLIAGYSLELNGKPAILSENYKRAAQKLSPTLGDVIKSED